MSVETTKIPNHQPSKRSRAPPPPTKKPSFEENKNGSLSELEKDALTKNGSTEETAGTSSGDERQLTVVLPEDKIVKASVKRDTPILELLIMIASKNKLNPTNYTIAQPGVRLKDPLVQLKPTQKLSDVVGDTIHIIRKNQKQVFVYKKEEKKSAVIEPTIRITVISSKNHKMCLRVDPTKTLQELMPTICDERGVELSNHTLRLTTQPQDPLEMSQTLEKSGAIEFLLVDLNGQPAGVEGGEADLMPEQKKKKGSFFGKLSKKKKGYELGAGGIPESQPTNVMPPVEKEKRSHRHTSPSSLPPSEGLTQTTGQEDEGSNTLKKRRPAPPPPPGKHVTTSTSASDDEKLDEDSSLASNNTLRKRRAPAPPRPTSPPRRSVSLGETSPHQIPVNLPPPRPVSPPIRASDAKEMKQISNSQETSTSVKGESPRVHSESISSSLTETGIDEAFEAAIAMGEAEIEAKKEEVAEDSPHQHETDLEVNVAGLILETKAEGTEEGMDQESAQEEGAKSQEMKETDEVSSGEIEQTAKDSKAKMELLSHMMKMSLDADTQDTDDYPPHTQADDTHDMFEEKSVHALAFEVTRESAEDSEGNAGESIEDQDEKVEEKERKDATKMEESYNKVEDENTDKTEEESVQEVVKEKEEMKADERPKKDEKGKLTSSEAPADTTVQKLNEQYSALQEQLAALQKQMVIPQQPGIMEIQMQQLQQQILLQQQIISQMMMSSNQQPMVMPLAFQQPGISPQQQMMLSPQQMMSPPQQMMISPQQQIMSQQMLSPQQQIMMSPQQLMMTPPMFSAVHSVPHNTAQPNVYTQQVMPTATVQAQSTPISSTHELNESTVSTTQDVALQINDDDSLSKNDESPSKSDLVSIKDDSPSSDDVITSEHTSDIKDDHEPQPLSPPMKADEVSVCHPTYHFARSRDVPKNEITGVKASPPSTLRSPQHQQRPPLFKSPESNEKKEVTETETKESPAAGNKEPTGTLGRRLTVDDHNLPPEERHMGDKADVSETEDKHVEDKADVSETEDKHMSGEKSSISAFAVANSEASKPASSSVPKSPKQKKSGFSLFKKKTPKYSYILSAQKEFSRKSETERQRTSSNPPEPTNKSESDQGSRGRAHTLDSYDPTRETHSLTFHLVRGGSQREMGDNVLISSKVPTYTTNEMHLNTDEQPVIPPRTSKPKTSNVKVSQANSSPQDGTTGALILSNQSPISVVTNTTLTTVTTCSSAPTVKISVEKSSITKPFLGISSVSYQEDPKPVEKSGKSQKSEPSPNNATVLENSSKQISPIPQKSKAESCDSFEEIPVPPVRKVHTKSNDACKTETIHVDVEIQPDRGTSESALYPRRRAEIHNYRSKEEEQAKVKGDASVSQLRQIFGQGNP